MPRRILMALLVSLSAASATTAADARLLRFPGIHGDRVAFSYAGNLYAVPAAGGVARRLTNHDGYEMFARFSPDGKWLAFTGQYDGNTEVYLMPAEGGVPKRLTYTATLGRDDVADRMGPNNIVIGWKHDGKSILFRSRMRSFNDFIGQLYTVTTDGGLPEQVELPRGGFASYSPDDTKRAYNRVFREFRTWKRYRGGMADDIWIFDFKTGAIEDITNNEAQDIIPMWAPNNKIYFISDRTGRFNLFSYDLASKQTKQLTTFTDFDIKFPSLGRGGIVFEQAGYVWFFDLSSEKARQVPIMIKEDLAIARGGILNVAKFVTRVRPSPDGKRAVVGARGEVFTVPVKNGPVRNLTNTSGAHERDASWSPDGRWIAYVSDQSGNNELWIRPLDGRGEPQPVTKNADTYYFAPLWSPDSKKLLWGDRKMRLRFVDIATKEITVVDETKTFEITDREWSPDSKWVAYVIPGPQGSNVRTDYGKLKLYSLEQKTAHEVTDGWYD